MPYQACFANITELTMCDAYVVDIDGDHAPEVLMTQGTGGDVVQLDVYKQNPAGKWGQIGTLTVANSAPTPSRRSRPASSS